MSSREILEDLSTFVGQLQEAPDTDVLAVVCAVARDTDEKGVGAVNAIAVGNADALVEVAVSLMSKLLRDDDACVTAATRMMLTIMEYKKELESKAQGAEDITRDLMAKLRGAK